MFGTGRETSELMFQTMRFVVVACYVVFHLVLFSANKGRTSVPPLASA